MSSKLLILALLIVVVSASPKASNSTRLLGFDRDAAGEQSSNLCGDQQGVCTEFVLAILRAGGSSDGSSLMANTLAQELIDAGWAKHGCTSCADGEVLWYPFGHVAYCHNGARDQWNPARCGATPYWGEETYCLTPP
eukprot:TRINITY_DN24_c0_g2_i1.p1 TRINITY_DN24_c0_g2~~TRINITY_DN24_c0_g2_i1.p1  ORF type:complete len:137 (-),score=37.26 TRINITY_DN24_c0_g2_i1:514-924(-)